VIYNGVVRAVERGGLDRGAVGALVDEQYGVPARIPADAKAFGVGLAMPVEKTGQEGFDFEYGAEFGQHILDLDPDFSKVLVRYNPDGDPTGNETQARRLRELSEWLHAREPTFLFELLVPAEQPQLAQVDGDADRYDAELRPELMRRAIAELQDRGVEVDIWKVEGLERRVDAEAVAAQARQGAGREGVVCIVLGRGASGERVEHWLREAAPAEGFVGFAVGRSIWADPLRAMLDGSLSRQQASERVADTYLRFIEVYDSPG
jgi:myo-inositol catabolism protein IolC